jgi:hypothetical protein
MRIAPVLGLGGLLACASTAPPAPPPAPAPSAAVEESQPAWGERAISQSGRLHGQLGPESGPIAINRFQTWVLELRDASGAPVVGAQVAIAGGMPAHGHGLPTQPRVTEEIGAGRYRIEGVKLNMVGDWVIEALVQTAAGTDRLRFALAVDY